MKIIHNLLLWLAAASTALSALADGTPLQGYDKTPERAATRTLQYRPTPDGRIECRNGDNLYTRALYGTNTLFRLETSDRPIFAAYHKRDNRNIHFSVTVGDKTLRLDSVADCVASYRGGERRYVLSDPSWGKGTITMTALALDDAEGAIWQVKASDMPRGARLTASTCSTVKVKINRSGDLGVDPKNAFAPAPDRANLRECTVDIGGKSATAYVRYLDRDVTATPRAGLARVYTRAKRAADALASRIVISTPDPYFNTLGPTLSHAGDGIWDGKTYQHGAIGWRMPLSGWRGAYTGDFLGWHDRARTHFDAYATSQVTDVPPTIPHPTQDSTKNLARAAKVWGTQMYSNGYICRNPGRNDQMHHYDMNLCYIDELLWHLNWTGDLDYARRMWPVIKSHLAWEKRNYDPDDDGLYDAYCCIWASDALYYNSGAVTHSTAYNHRANAMAAEIAAKIGEDPTPYRDEAAKILSALNSTLWMPSKGVWAEFKDRMGAGRLHDHPAVWTVYHAVDGDVADPFQAYSATRYVDRSIPHIPVTADGLDDGGEYATISTTDWMPYAWSINNVAFAEVMNTALAYYQAGRPDRATRLLKSSMLDGMFIGDSPGNIGQISHYDAARGECYRDFADPVGVMSRAVVQGLFGFSPDALNGRATITPGFPADWDHASISHPDFDLAFKRQGRQDKYDIKVALPRVTTVTLRVPAPTDSVRSVTVNGRDVRWSLVDSAVGRPVIAVETPVNATVAIDWAGQPLATALATVKGYNDRGFRHVAAGEMEWWEEPGVAPVTDKLPAQLGLNPVKGTSYDPVDISAAFNSSADDIFRNEYLSPRSPYTTLEIPKQGIGEWCHPDETANIDDSGLRAASADGVFTALDIPFLTPSEGPNVVYTSLFDNYPNSVTVPLSGKARGVNLLLVGSTNHMQCHLENARVTVRYTDGTTETLPLIAPYNWAPVEQDYFIDGKAFSVPTARPWRFTLKALAGKDGDTPSVRVSRDLGTDLGIEGVYLRRIDGGAGLILGLPLDPSRTLESLTLTAVSNDIVAGLLAATLVR